MKKKLASNLMLGPQHLIQQLPKKRKAGPKRQAPLSSYLQRAQVTLN